MTCYCGVGVTLSFVLMTKVYQKKVEHDSMLVAVNER